MMHLSRFALISICRSEQSRKAPYLIGRKGVVLASKLDENLSGLDQVCSLLQVDSKLREPRPLADVSGAVFGANRPTVDSALVNGHIDLGRA